MSGKVKSLHGVYRALGRDAFLAAARLYSENVQDTVEATLSEGKCRWYNKEKKITRSGQNGQRFSNGYLTP